MGFYSTVFLSRDQIADVNILEGEAMYFAHSFKGFVHYAGRMW
jgi:hypothetical protein